MTPPFTVYDSRNDLRNIVVMPEIRGRFLRMEPGEVGPFHSHDVGQELFLVLAGQAEFEIDGVRQVVGPGQLCVARAGELHEVRVIGEQPMTLFLTVTPHLEPTHTLWDGDQPLPPVYGYWTPAGLGDQEPPTATLADLAAAQALALADLATKIEAQGRILAEAEATLRQTDVDADPQRAKAAVDAVWAELRPTYVAFTRLVATWNQLALRMGITQANERADQ